MKKWRRLTDEEAMAELKQIALEQEMLDSSFGNVTQDDSTSDNTNSDEVLDESQVMDTNQEEAIQ